MMTALPETLDGMRAAARRRLPRGLFEFVDRGTEDETALENNRAAFDRVRLCPRVLRDVSARSTATTLFGRAFGLPLAIAPTGAAGLMCYRGDVALGHAAALAGVPFTMATRSMASAEEVARVTGAEIWFQLYPSAPDAAELMARARGAGCDVLVVTVDTPVTPLRRYNARNGFALPFRPSARALLDMAMHPRWSVGVIGRHMVAGGLPRFENLTGRPRITEGAPAAGMLEGRLDWDRLKVLRNAWAGKLVVKGVLHPDDAVTAAGIGADAVLVSNHGGRNLDTGIASMDALGPVARALAGRIPVLLDSGVRRGSDIAKALALGAAAVLIGRPALWGAAVAGADGVARVLETLRFELDYTMAMCGCRTIGDIGPGLLAPES